MNLGEQIWCVLSEETSFETFTPIWSHVNENETKIAKNSKFHYSFKTLAETLPRSMHVFGSESDVYFQRSRLKCFLPYCPMLTKTNKRPRGHDALLELKTQYTRMFNVLKSFTYMLS